MYIRPFKESHVLKMGEQDVRRMNWVSREPPYQPWTSFAYVYV